MSHNSTSHLTAYQCAQIVNAVLEEKGVDHRIPNQMMYNYAKQGLLRTYVHEGRKYIDQEDFARWLKSYVSKKLATTNRGEVARDFIAKLDI